MSGQQGSSGKPTIVHYSSFLHHYRFVPYKYACGCAIIELGKGLPPRHVRNMVHLLIEPKDPSGLTLRHSCLLARSSASRKDESCNLAHSQERKVPCFNAC